MIISATPIPGNEIMVSRIIDQLYRCGANVVYGQIADVHVSGHAWQEEIKEMMGGMGINAIEALRGNRLMLRGVVRVWPRPCTGIVLVQASFRTGTVGGEA